MASSVTTPEPQWLAERRERAATLSGELELPSFKGRAGWEFTDLTKLDLSAYAAVNGQGGDVSAVRDAGVLFKGIEGALHLEQVDGLPVGDVDVPDAATEPLVLPLSVAATRFPELVEGHLGTVVDDADPFVARNQEAWTGGAFVYVPRGVKLDAPAAITAVQSAAEHGDVVAHADRPRRGRGGRGLGAVAVGRSRSSTRSSTASPRSSSARTRS